MQTKIKRHTPSDERRWVSGDEVESRCVKCSKTIRSFYDYDDDRGWFWYHWSSEPDHKAVCSA
jgi:hypothetical protein